jgi:Na+-transporting methylmalonyl-CoA/oxaloacetate decarboxylase gamma subunit
MSQYVLIAGAVSEIIGLILVASATANTYIKGSQATDTSQKSSLHASGIFLGISMIFAIISLVSGFITLGTKGCSRKAKWIFIIFFTLFVISYIIALVILYVFKTRLQSEGMTDEASSLNSSFILAIVGVGFYLLGFILFYVVIGKKLRSVGKICKKAKKVIKKVKTEEKQVKGKVQQVESKAQEAESRA